MKRALIAGIAGQDGAYLAELIRAHILSPKMATTRDVIQHVKIP